MQGTLIAWLLGSLILVPLILAGGGYWITLGYVLGAIMTMLQIHLMEKLDK
ncbi:hypothetical protein PYDG_00051 [Pseudoalteromonas phage pYD6-A]|uniref:Uncharacterized protein n=1 Tax=Pseudoalteromonas phage pYD6-A TaxID=754052 RepID=M4SMI7_9CAUD|nr:hypothetical protein PYDG_00051 [Pseudoalteromonas phage pYD6-A]AGH57582.1 hypothetical protein PYDG_00051 [Pseudoalteromonas phage pYD6-A]